MRLKPAWVIPSCLLVWVPFTICGFWSTRLFLEAGNHLTFAVPQPLLPVPFAMLCGLFLFRSLKELALVVVASVPAYFAAHFSALGAFAFMDNLGATTFQERWSPFLAMCLGSLIGALCMTHIFGSFHPHLLSRRYQAGAAAVGCIAALPLGFWLRSFFAVPTFPEPHILLFRCSFAVWQAAFGTYLCVACTLGEKMGVPTGSGGGHSANSAP